MKIKFLSIFLNFVQQTTQAERCIAIDCDLNIVDRIHFSQDITETQEFRQLAGEFAQRALKTKSTLITNDTIPNPADAPITNTTFKDLRIVIVIPIGELGAIVLDQAIGMGIIPQAIIQQLSQLAKEIAEEQAYSLNADELQERYSRLENASAV